MSEISPEFNQERIKTLTQTAKGVWFGYLGALAFTGVTLLGVEDVDFFKLDSNTELPLIGVSVPVTSFFWAGALLLAIVYCYLHVFLEKLWSELASYKKHVKDGTPVSRYIHPWLISDFALFVRYKVRDEKPPPIMVSPLTNIGMFASAVLGWAAGPFVLAFFWLWSQPAHQFWMTWTCGMAFVVATYSMIESLRSLHWKMNVSDGDFLLLHEGVLPRFVVVVAVVVVSLTSLMRTEWDYRNYGERVAPVGFSFFDFRQWLRPVPADLIEANLTELPSDWQTRDTAMKAFFADWCKRPDTPDCEDEIDIKSDKGFQAEWIAKRATYLRVLAKPNLQNRDLSFADLSQAHLPGLDLRSVNLKGANLRLAQMEGANLRFAQINGAVLNGAQMEGADLKFAEMEGANLRLAEMNGADLFEAQMEGANLRLAEMNGADLSGAQMEGANLYGAQMEGANLSGAQMEGANLSFALMEEASLYSAQMQGANLYSAQMQGANLAGAQMEGADLRRVQMKGANLSYTVLIGTQEHTNLLQSTNLKASTNNGGAFRFVDLGAAITDDQTDFRNSFGDGSVILPKSIGRPCQWAAAELSDQDFYGRWRGWIELRDEVVWILISPEGFEEVEPIAPPAGCEWQTDPINASVP